jgi:hypothetical protein
MPVIPKLSRKFYETFGDDIANELVEWFNQVDLTYRGELRELNEINYARFDAKLEQRIAEIKAELRQEIGQLRAELHEGIAQLRADLRAGLAELRGEFRGELGSGLATLRADLMKWMFIFWAGSTATMIGVAVALARFLRP